MSPAKHFLLSALVVGALALATPVQAQPAGYDAALATELGADEYGMRRYVMAFLRRGPNRPQDPEAAAALMQMAELHARIARASP